MADKKAHHTTRSLPVSPAEGRTHIIDELLDEAVRVLGESIAPVSPGEGWAACLVRREGERRDLLSRITKLRAAAVLVLHPSPEPPDSPHLRDDYREVWLSGWRAGVLASPPAPGTEDR